MLVDDILGHEINHTQFLGNVCSQFLHETGNLPLLKSLPVSYSDIQKVKARKQKRSDVVSEVFNKAFNSTWMDLRQRAIIAYPSNPPISEQTEPFYVLPINGYQYMYSKEVTNSTSNYKQMIDVLFEQFSNNYQALDIITDLLKFTYTNTDLIEGIQSQSEIILYGIPYYYAVRVATYPNYQELITTINKYNKRT